MNRRSSIQSRKFLFRRRSRLTVGSVATVVIAAVLVYICSLVSYAGYFTIDDIAISGIEESDTASVHDAIADTLEGSYMGLFSRANSLIFSRSAIQDVLRNRYPEVASVVVARQGLRGLTVSVTEKEPGGLVCATLPEFDGNHISLNDPGTCYFADASGYIYRKAPSFSGSVYDRYYVPDLESSGDAVIGAHVASSTEFDEMRSIYADVKAGRIAVDAMLMKGGGEYELYVRNPGVASSTAVVYIRTTASTTEQVSNLVSFWDHMVGTSRSTKSVPEFDSIDVRYGDNVFYRLVK